MASSGQSGENGLPLNVLALRVNAGAQLTPRQIAERFESLDHFLTYCMCVAAIRDPRVFPQMPVGSNQSLTSISLTALLARPEEDRDPYSRYAQPPNRQERSYIKDLAAILQGAVAGESFVVIETSYRNPWETVIKAVAETGGPAFYAVTGLLIAKQALASLIEWQNHRLAVREKQLELDGKRRALESGQSSPPANSLTQSETGRRELLLQIPDHEIIEELGLRIKQSETSNSGDANKAPQGISFEEERGARAAVIAKMGEFLSVDLRSMDEGSQRQASDTGQAPPNQ